MNRDEKISILNNVKMIREGIFPGISDRKLQVTLDTLDMLLDLETIDTDNTIFDGVNIYQFRDVLMALVEINLERMLDGSSEFEFYDLAHSLELYAAANFN
jgi:hypothetical protein